MRRCKKRKRLRKPRVAEIPPQLLDQLVKGVITVEPVEYASEYLGKR
jgi:hypothetical protein